MIKVIQICTAAVFVAIAVYNEYHLRFQFGVITIELEKAVGSPWRGL